MNNTLQAPTQSPCAVVDRCGGCPLYGLSVAEERDLKLWRVRDALTVYLSPSALPEICWVSAPSRTEYRNRIRLRVTESGSIAFFNSEKHEGCVALEPSLRASVLSLQRLAEAHERALSCFAHLEVRKPDELDRPGVLFTLRPATEVTSHADRALRTLDSHWLVGIEGPGEASAGKVQRHAVSEGVRVDVPLEGFMQVNSRVNALLVECLVDGACRERLRTFADLYGGSGNFSLPLAARGLSGVCVERFRGSIAALDRAAADQDLSVEGIAGDAIEQATRWASTGARFDLVITDAPRAGLKGGYEAIRSIAGRVIAVCSCNPHTFARDVARLCERDFRLERVTALDMFPGTRHVEILGWLSRNG